MGPCASTALHWPERWWDQCVEFDQGISSNLIPSKNQLDTLDPEQKVIMRQRLLHLGMKI
jgi:hypothetical protein